MRRAAAAADRKAKKAGEAAPGPSSEAQPDSAGAPEVAEDSAAGKKSVGKAPGGSRPRGRQARSKAAEASGEAAMATADAGDQMQAVEPREGGADGAATTAPVVAPGLGEAAGAGADGEQTAQVEALAPAPAKKRGRPAIKRGPEGAAGSSEAVEAAAAEEEAAVQAAVPAKAPAKKRGRIAVLDAQVPGVPAAAAPAEAPEAGSAPTAPAGKVKAGAKPGKRARK